MTAMGSDSDLCGEVVIAYTRTQALADGVLVDVTDTAREAGFTVPVTVTARVWAECVAVPAGCEGVQDQAGRLWSTLRSAHVAVIRSPK